MKIKKIKKCKHCEFLNGRFLTNGHKTQREYWLWTEMFVYLHGTDECDGYEEQKELPKI